MKLSARIARLERLASAQRARLEERQQREAESHAEREAAWAIMQRTMSEEHVRLVVDTYAETRGAWDHPLYHTLGSRLLRHCLDAMSSLKYRHWPHRDIPPEVVLAMPPVLAEILVAHDELRLHECEDCGYKLPVKCFEACPLCGGRVGYPAYYHKRKAEADAAAQGHPD